MGTIHVLYVEGLPQRIEMFTSYAEEVRQQTECFARKAKEVPQPIEKFQKEESQKRKRKRKNSVAETEEGLNAGRVLCTVSSPSDLFPAPGEREGRVSPGRRGKVECQALPSGSETG